MNEALRVEKKSFRVIMGSNLCSEEFTNDLVGNSPEFQRIEKYSKKVAKFDTIVMIGGESGTGKTEIAKLIHCNSGRAGNFVTVNCSAIPENLIESEFFGHTKGAFTGAVEKRDGKFKEADQGTLFLDEIGDMSLSAQTKLLKAIDEGSFYPVGSAVKVETKTRIIVASNKDLTKEVRNGNFRQDLFYRINVVNIFMPPLRERGGDIDGLIRYYTDKFKKKYQSNAVMSDAVFNIMRKYHWPGNIRELANVIERAYTVCEEKFITPKHLGIDLGATSVTAIPERMDEAINLFKKEFILFSLKNNGLNRTQAASRMSVQRTYLSRLLTRYKITDQEIIANQESQFFNFAVHGSGQDPIFKSSTVGEAIKEAIQERPGTDRVEKLPVKKGDKKKELKCQPDIYKNDIRRHKADEIILRYSGRLKLAWEKAEAEFRKIGITSVHSLDFFLRRNGLNRDGRYKEARLSFLQDSKKSGDLDMLFLKCGGSLKETAKKLFIYPSELKKVL